MSSRKSSENKLEMAALSGTFNMIHPEQKQRLDGLERMRVLSKNCVAMGTSVITICTGSRDPVDKWRHHADNNSVAAWKELTYILGKALYLAEEQNIVLAFEPEVANVVNSIEKAKRLLREMRSKHLKVVFDAANLFEIASQKQIRYLISKGVDQLGEHIAIVHAKGKNEKGDFVAAGKGIIPFQHLMKELAQIPFAGPMVTHGLIEEEVPEVFELLSELLR